MPTSADSVTSGNLLHKTVLSKKCTPSIIRKLVRDQPELLNGADSQNCTPLHLAVDPYPRYNIIYELLCLGADVDALEEHQFTPLDLVILRYFQKINFIKQCLLKYNFKLDEMNWDKFLFENVKESTLLLMNSADTVSKEDVNRFKVALNSLPKYVAAAKLFLEFGSNNIVLSQENSNGTSYNVYKYSAKITKLLLQFFTIYELKECQSSFKTLHFPQQYYDFLTHKYNDLSGINGIECESELLTFRDTLIHELIDMMKEKIDENYTLFSFIFEHRSSGLSCKNLEMSTIVKILSTLHYKQYTCSYDLIDTSLKRHHLLSYFYKLDIYGIKPSCKIFGIGNKVRLNYLAMSYLVEYLTKEDIINLILAYSFGVEYKEKFLAITSFVDQNSLSEISSESFFSSNDIKVTMPIKKINFI